MEKDWVLVYTANKKYNADVLEEIFNDYDIKSIAINKKDSLYVTIGNIEIYVHKDNEEKAKELIKEFEN